jgi:post-segregation antitoxin (ccd killing protein)
MTYAHIRSTPTKRRPVNISLSQDFVGKAKSSGINISAVAEAALSSAVQDARLAAWTQENVKGLAALSKFIEEEGFSLANLRLW